MTSAQPALRLPLLPTVPSPTEPNARFAELADPATLERTERALRERGFDVVVAHDAADARDRVLALLPPGGSVLEASSQTLTALGVNSALLAERGFHPTKPRLIELMTAGKANEARELGAAPQAVIGSVHAITESGEVLVASASGSQLASYSYGASRVIWVVGTQKIVPDLESAERRLEEYVFPLENERAQKAYGRGSLIGKLLLVNREVQPGRVTVVLVPERLGF